MSSIFDPGLQPERTELAWRRTALALGAVSLVALRLLPIGLGHPGWVLVGSTGVVLAAALAASARRRSRIVVTRLMVGGDHAQLPDAALLGLLSAAVSLLGFVALATVALRELSRAG